MPSGDSITSPDNSAADSFVELNERLRSLKGDIEYYNQLKARAQNALENHRSDLTLLQQKERAIFAAKEDDLRLKLQETLKLNREMFQQIEKARREVHQELRDELFATHTEGSTRLSSLQEEMEALWRERLQLEHDLTHLEGEATRIKGLMQIDLYEQSCLHTELQEAKQALLDNLHKTIPRERSCNAYSRSILEPLVGLKSSTLASPWRMASPKKQFVPSGPTILRARSRSLSRSSSRRCGGAGSWGSLCRAAHPPASHNVASMVATLERRNYLRPRAYLQRHGRDMGYQTPLTKRVGGALPPPLVDLSPAPFQGPEEETNKAAVAKGGSPREAASLVGKTATADTSASSSSGSGSTDKGAFSVSQRGACAPATGHYTKSRTRRLGSPTPDERAAVPIAEGLALNAACQTLKEEIAELERSYAAFYQQLHDPCCDSVVASQQMRQLMVVIDRKADQLRTLRFQQHKHRDKLRINHILKQVERENNWCEQVYSNIVHLVRSS